MLYQCPCSLFSNKNNNYRKYSISICVKYSIYFLKNYSIKNIVIILFEPGGLLNEATIIEKIILYNIKNKINAKFIIQIIEEDHQNKNIKNAHKYFLKKFQKYNNINIYFNTILTINTNIKYDYLLLISIDPYNYLYLKYFKNITEDIKELNQKIPFIFILLLHARDAFFYITQLSIIIANNKMYNNFFLEYNFLGNKNNFFYMQEIIH
jgi:hypothetical protein